jgi:hypothetical protein
MKKHCLTGICRVVPFDFFEVVKLLDVRQNNKNEGKDFYFSEPNLRKITCNCLKKIVSEAFAEF